MSNTKELLRARFDELNKQRDAILAASGPLREERDRLVNDARARENEINARIKEAERGLYEIDCDRAMLARALGGRAMSDNRGR